jgi:hypothetical protein
VVGSLAFARPCAAASTTYALDCGVQNLSAAACASSAAVEVIAITAGQVDRVFELISQPAAVPESASLMLVGCTLFVVAAGARRFSKGK